jgi:hypothetical protein
MDPWDQTTLRSEQPVASTYQKGLREMFPACREPAPRRMRELIERLKKQDDETRH